MDDTGTHDPTGQQRGADVVGVVGYVSRFHRWGRLDIEWRAALRKYKVGMFHAADLQWGRGDFVGWTREHKDAFALELSSIVHRHTMFGVGGLCLVEDFMSLPPTFRNEIGHPFFVGLYNLLNEFISGEIVPELRGRKVDFVFDQQDQLGRQTQHIFKQIRAAKGTNVLGQIRFAESWALSFLQCADLAAYHIRAEISRLRYKQHLDVWPAMAALQQKHQLSVVYSDRKMLWDLYTKLRIERALRS